MLKKLINIFRNIEDDNKTYSDEFIEFYKDCIKEFPKVLKDNLKTRKLNPCVPNQKVSESYIVEFTMADLLWWEGIIETVNPFFKTPDDFKKEVLMAALDCFDRLNLPDDKYKKYICELVDNIDK